MPELTIADLVEAYAEDAVDLARQQFGVRLDYSKNSIAQVERVLDSLHGNAVEGAARPAGEAGTSGIVGL